MGEMEAAVDLVQLGKLDTVCDRYRAVSGRILRQLGTFTQIRPQTINDAAGFIGYQLRLFPQTFELAQRIAAGNVQDALSQWTSGYDSSLRNSVFNTLP